MALPSFEGSRSAGTSAIEQEDELLNGKIQVFPNPASVSISVINGLSEDGKYLVELKDLLGRSVYSQSINKSSKLDIPVKNLSSGVYIIKITRNENETAYKARVLKQD